MRWEKLCTESWASIEAAWETLRLSADASVFLSWSWLDTWRQSFSEPTQFWSASQDGSLVAALPLTERYHWGLKFLHVAGDGCLCPDHLDIMAPKALQEQAWKTWLAQAKHQADILVVNGLREDSLLPNVLLENKRFFLVRGFRPCPYLNLSNVNDWSSFETRLVPKLAKELRYLKRRFSRDWPQSQVRSLTNPAQIDAALQQLAAWSIARKSESSWNDARFVTFHHHLAKRLAKRDQLGLYRLDDGEQTMAIAYGFRDQGTYSYYQPSFDTNYARYAPSKLIMAHILREQISQGQREFDFLLGDEPYKFEWGPQIRHERRLWVALSTAGAMLLRLLAWRGKSEQVGKS